ncbi:MAG: hypothetical protein ABIH42_03455 [Planctomycetota bacterium]
MVRFLFFIVTATVSCGLILWVGGDIKFEETVTSELQKQEPPEEISVVDAGDELMLKQKLTNWSFRGFNSEVGKYDLFASGKEVVPSADKSKKRETYIATEIKVHTISFTKEVNQVKEESHVRISAENGKITLDQNHKLLAGDFTGSTILDFEPVNETEQQQPVHLETEELIITPLGSVKGITGTELKIETKGKTRTKIGNSEFYSNGAVTSTHEKTITIIPPVEMYFSPEQLKHFFPQNKKSPDTNFFKLTTEGAVSVIEKKETGTKKINFDHKVSLSDGESYLLCEELLLVVKSDGTASDLQAKGDVRLTREGISCIAETLICNMGKKSILLTGAPDVIIKDGTNEFFGGSAELKDDGSYAHLSNKVVVRYKVTNKEGGEELFSLWCDDAEIWFKENKQTKKKQVERAIARSEKGKSVRTEGADFTITGAYFEFSSGSSSVPCIRSEGADNIPAKLKRTGGQEISAMAIQLNFDDNNVTFSDNVTAFLKSGIGEEKTKWNFSADKASVWFEKDSASGESTPVMIFAESASEVEAKCIYQHYEFSFKSASLLYNKKENLITLSPAEKSPKRPQIREGNNFFNANRINLYLNKNTLLLSEGVDGEMFIPSQNKTTAASENLFSGDWSISCKDLEAAFSNTETKELTSFKAKDSVKFNKKDGSCKITCGMLTFDRNTGVLSLSTNNLDSKPAIVANDNFFTAYKIELDLQNNRVKLSRNVEAAILLPSRGNENNPAEKPVFGGTWLISCDNIEAYFDDEKRVSELHAKGPVRAVNKNAECEVTCDTLSYDKATSIMVLSGDKTEPVLKRKNDFAKAKAIHIQTDNNIITLKEKAEFQSTPEEKNKPSFSLKADTIYAKFALKSQQPEEVYARKNVRSNIIQPNGDTTEISADEVVFQAMHQSISAIGSPCTIIQPQITLKDNEVLYDMENKIIKTKPGENRYDWEVDPSDWRKKP